MMCKYILLFGMFSFNFIDDLICFTQGFKFDGQGGLACCGSWGRKELDTTEWLNWTELNCLFIFAFVICVFGVNSKKQSHQDRS